MTFGAIFKSCSFSVKTHWATFGKIGQPLIPKSGHAGSEQVEAKTNDK